MNYYVENLTPQLFAEIKPFLIKSREEVYIIKEDNILPEMMGNTVNYIDYNYFYNLQNSNNLLICTVRDNGILVGYWGLSLIHHQQSNNVFVAKSINIYVEKEYRKNNISINLIKFTEDVLKRIGINQIQFGVNPQLKTDKLLKRLGYNLDEVVYQKSFRR